MVTVEIAGRRIGPGARCFVIAEGGVNHNGDMRLARGLVEAAAAQGAARLYRVGIAGCACGGCSSM